MIRVHLSVANHHVCQCKPSQLTNVQSNQVMDNLLKYNSSLSKFLSKYRQSQTHKTQPQIQIPNKIQNYRSIVQQRGLRPMLIDRKYKQDVETMTDPILDKNKHQEKEKLKQDNQRQKNPSNKPTIERRPIINKKDLSPDPNIHPQIKQHLKQLADGSRYLADTAFRKYFNRQVFQNYGRSNTSGRGDGIIYGNYLKTHNINPHSGQNIHSIKEVYSGAINSQHNILSQSRKHLEEQTQIKSHEKSRDYQGRKPQYQMEIQKSPKTIKQKKQKPKIPSPKNNLNLSRGNDKTKIAKNQRNYPEVSLKLVEHNKSKINEDNKMKMSNYKQQEDPYQIAHKNSNQRQNREDRNREDRNREDRNREDKIREDRNRENTQNKDCSNSGSHERDCKCCLDKIKRAILEQAYEDQDLACRILSTAKKATLYKNFSVNNVQHGAKNPHNYRQCTGQLNVMHN